MEKIPKETYFRSNKEKSDELKSKINMKTKILLFLLIIAPYSFLSAKKTVPAKSSATKPWPKSLSTLIKEITLENPNIHFKKGKTHDKLNSYIANYGGKLSLMIYADHDRPKLVFYMVIMDGKDPGINGRLKDVHNLILATWGASRADWITAELNQVKQNDQQYLKIRMPDKEVKLEFEYQPARKSVEITFNQILTKKP
jgi:hypothetical protein